jgi:O-antigen ligase
MKGLIALLLLACGIAMVFLEVISPRNRPDGGVLLGAMGLMLVIVAMVLDRDRLRRNHKDK